MKKFFYPTALLGLFCTTSLHAEAAAAPGDQGFTQTLVMLAIAMLFFYFILYRPEQKRRKELEDSRDTMNKGDQVVAMGIVGTVDKVQKETVVLKMVDGSSKIEVVKGAISEVRTTKGETKEG